MASRKVHYPWQSSHPSVRFQPVAPVPGEVTESTMQRLMERLNERVAENIWFDPVNPEVDPDATYEASSFAASHAGGSAIGSGAPATGQGSRRSKRSSKRSSRNSSDRVGGSASGGGEAPTIPPLPLLEMKAVPHDRTRPALPEFGPDYRPVRELVPGLAHTARPPGEHLGKPSWKLESPKVRSIAPFGSAPVTTNA